MPLFAGAFAMAVWLDRRYSWPVQGEVVVDFLAWLGSAVTVASLLLFAAGMAIFARARTGILLQKSATRLVTTGPYRWSRNPMYVSFVALYIGGALLANTVWPLVILPIVVAMLVRFVIAREEDYLRRTFRDAYDDYTRQVPRWL